MSNTGWILAEPTIQIGLVFVAAMNVLMCVNMLRNLRAIKLRAKQAEELPQFREGEGVDITGGESSEDYARRMRDE